MSRTFSVRLNTDEALAFQDWLDNAGLSATDALGMLIREAIKKAPVRHRPNECALCRRVIPTGSYAIHKGNYIFDSLECFGLWLEEQLKAAIAEAAGIILIDVSVNLNVRHILGVTKYTDADRRHYLQDTDRQRYSITAISEKKKGRKPQRCAVCGRTFGPADVVDDALVVGAYPTKVGYAHLGCLLPSPNQLGRLREATAFAVRDFTEAVARDAEGSVPTITLDLEDIELGVVAI